ncbi:MAG: isocitrate lyase/PEP mutase family protein [Clostridiaceae bacterium]|jgi:methylisocitrate lyase|nr:isocitrate lyase/PEP mutase family protein [Clostridiaceae bacterium]
MNRKLTLREVIESEPIIMCPEIYDCISAKAVEMCNFKAILLSSAEFSCSRLGQPDLGFHSIDDLVHATYFISRVTHLPLIVDADDCFGSPMKTYAACERMVNAGAAGILITDSGDNGVIEMEDAIARFKAAKTAMEGSDCMLIARCDINPYTNFDEACERCNAYVDAGADMTLIVNINADFYSDKVELCKRISERVKGWKMYPDLGAHDGKPDVDIDKIAPFGFRLVGIHYTLYAAFEGMLDYGHHIYKDRSNVYQNVHNKPGYKFSSPPVFFGIEDGKWEKIEEKFIDNPKKRRMPRLREFFMNNISGLK